MTQVHPAEPDKAGAGTAVQLESASPSKLPLPPIGGGPSPNGSPNISPHGTPKWGKAIGDVVALQSTLTALAEDHTDKEMNALRLQLEQNAMKLLVSSQGAHLKERMGVKVYLENRPQAEDGSWEITRCPLLILDLIHPIHQFQY